MFAEDIIIKPVLTEKGYDGIASKKYTFIVTHMGLNKDERENAVKTILSIAPEERCIIMGDFNDSPIDKSISVALGAKPLEAPYINENLYNIR